MTQWSELQLQSWPTPRETLLDEKLHSTKRFRPFKAYTYCVTDGFENCHQICANLENWAWLKMIMHHFWKYYKSTFPTATPFNKPTSELDYSEIKMATQRLAFAALIFAATASMASAASPVTFIFGDSLTEVGNNNYLQYSLAKSNFPFYGIDYVGGQATGRFTNGRTIGDIVCMLITPKLQCLSFPFSFFAWFLWIALKLFMQLDVVFH